MTIYDSVLRVANETGFTPDAVLSVWWLLSVFEGAAFVGACILVGRLVARILNHYFPRPH